MKKGLFLSMPVVALWASGKQGLHLLQTPTVLAPYSLASFSHSSLTCSEATSPSESF